MNDKQIDEFKKVVVQWVQLDDIIREKMAELKEIKTDKKSLEEYILESMDKLDEEMIDISDGKLRVNKSKRTAALKQEYIQETLKEFTNDASQAEQMTKLILGKRQIVETKKLSRTFTRKPKVKK